MILSIDYTQNTQIDQLGGDEFLIQFTGKIDTFQPADDKSYHYLLFAVLNYDEDSDPPQSFDVKEVLKLNPYFTDTTTFIPFQAEEQTMRKAVGCSRDTTFWRPVRPVFIDFNDFANNALYFTTFTDWAGYGVRKSYSKYNQRDLTDIDCTDLFDYWDATTLINKISSCTRLIDEKKQLLINTIKKLVNKYPDFDLFKIRFYNQVEEVADVQIMGYDTDIDYYEVLHEWRTQRGKDWLKPELIEGYAPKVNRFFSFTRAGELGKCSYSIVPTFLDTCQEIIEDKEVNYLLFPELRKDYVDTTCGKVYSEAVVYTVLQSEKIFSKDWTQGTVAWNYSNIAANYRTRNGVIPRKVKQSDITLEIVKKMIGDRLVKENFVKMLKDIYINYKHKIGPEEVVVTDFTSDFTDAVQALENGFASKDVDIILNNKVQKNILNHKYFHPYKLFNKDGSESEYEIRVFWNDGVKAVDVTEVLVGYDEDRFEYLRLKENKFDWDFYVNKAMYSQLNYKIESFEDNDYKALTVDNAIDIGTEVLANFIGDEFLACLVDNMSNYDSPNILRRIQYLPDSIREVMEQTVNDAKSLKSDIESGKITLDQIKDGCKDCNASESSGDPPCGYDILQKLREIRGLRYYTIKKWGQSFSKDSAVSFVIDDIPRNHSQPHRRFYFEYSCEVKDIKQHKRIMTLINYLVEDDEVLAYYPSIIKFGKRPSDEIWLPITEDTPIEIIEDIADGSFTKCMPTSTIPAVDAGGNVFVPVFSLDDSQVIEPIAYDTTDTTSSDTTAWSQIEADNTLYIVNIRSAETLTEIYYQLRICSNLTVQEVDLSKTTKEEAFIPLYVTDAALI